MLQLLNPKIRTESAMTQSAAGVLSTVMKLAASEEPKNHAFQLSRAGLGGGGVEGVGPAGARQAPEVEHGGGREQRGERGRAAARVAARGTGGAAPAAPAAAGA